MEGVTVFFTYSLFANSIMHFLSVQLEVCSLQPMGFMEASILYSGVEDVNVISRWDAGQKFCIRITVSDGSVLLQVGTTFQYNLHYKFPQINTILRQFTRHMM